MIKEGNETVTNCDSFKIKAKDGKLRNTDMLDTEGIFRLIESVPSPNAEPFKLLLAKLGRKEIDAKEYKEFKGIRKESLRDNMSDIEVVLTDLGEIATRHLAKEKRPFGLDENKKIVNEGGSVARVAKDTLEEKLGKSVIDNKNKLDYSYEK